MSYCRFGWEGSDVYVYQSDQGFECCGCSISENWTFDTPEDMIHHLAQHKRTGHFVPEDVIPALWEDVEGPDKPFAISPYFAYMGEWTKNLTRCIQAKCIDPETCEHKAENEKIWTSIEEIQNNMRKEWAK